MTNEVNVRTEGSRHFQLDRAILLYTSRTQADGLGNQSSNDVYAMLHTIERGKGGTRLGTGRPATVEACADFARAMADRGSFAGFLAPSMLYVGPQCVAWWRAPARARVWFEAAAAEHDTADMRIGTRSEITPHPGLVFAVAHGRWFVWALRGPDRPGPDTQLYRAPYFNVWARGEICEGNIRRPGRVTPESLADFERAFFDSRFTHPNDPRKLTLFKGGGYALWKALLDGKWKGRFPDQSLVRAGATLAAALRKMEAGPRAND